VANKFKVVRVDKTGATSDPMVEEREELDKIDAGLIGIDCPTEDDLIKAARDADAVITSSAPMTRHIMEELPKCRVIVRYGVGYDTVDIKAATDLGILVVNLPKFCPEEVSNHAIGFLLICARKLVFLNNRLKQGHWDREHLAPMGSIDGQTLGIIGCGNIGSMVARKAQCFGLKLLGSDPYVDKSLAKENGITLVSLPKLLKESDYVTVHTPLNEETRHLMGEKEFKQMKPTAYFFNTARGPIVDEAALIKALQNKWLAGAGLDVFEKEPVDPANPLLKMDNVVVTPHAAFYSDASAKRQGTGVGSEAARVLRGLWPENVVNKTVKPKIKLVREK